MSTHTSASSQKTRPLGPIEYLYWFMDRSARTHFVVVAECRNPIPQQALQQSLQKLQESSAALQACIQISPKQGVYFQLQKDIPPIPLRTVRYSKAGLSPSGEGERPLEHPGSTDWLQVAEEDKNAPFDTEKGPLLRCALLQPDEEDASHIILLTFHHTIGDASSGFQMMQHLLSLLDQALSQTEEVPSSLETSTLPKEHAESLPAPAHAFIPKHFLGFRGLWKFLVFSTRNLMRWLVKGKPKQAPIDQDVPAHQRRDRLLLCAVPPELFRKLRQLCKTNQVSLHHMLCAVQLSAVQSSFDKASKKRLAQMSLCDLRKQTSPPISSDICSPHISFLLTEHDVHSQTDIWELAKDIKQAMTKDLQAQNYYLTLPWMATFTQKMTQKKPTVKESQKAVVLGEKAAPPATIVSNIGHIPSMSKFKHLHLQHCYFLVSLSGAGLFGSSVTTYQEHLHWNFTYAEPTISRQRALKLTNRAIQILQDLAATK